MAYYLLSVIHAHLFSSLFHGKAESSDVFLQTDRYFNGKPSEMLFYPLDDSINKGIASLGRLREVVIGILDPQHVRKLLILFAPSQRYSQALYEDIFVDVGWHILVGHRIGNKRSDLLGSNVTHLVGEFFGSQIERKHVVLRHPAAQGGIPFCCYRCNIIAFARHDLFAFP